MKKVITSSALAISLASAGSISGVGLAYSYGEDKSKNITTFLNYTILTGVDIRLEYSRNLSDYKDFYKSVINRYGAYATYTMPLGYSFSVTPKIGLVKTDGEFELVDTLKKVSDSSTNFTYGIELNYEFNDMVSIFAGYTDYGHKFKSIKSIKASDIDSKNYTVGFKLDL